MNLPNIFTVCTCTGLVEQFLTMYQHVKYSPTHILLTCQHAWHCKNCIFVRFVMHTGTALWHDAHICMVMTVRQT